MADPNTVQLSQESLALLQKMNGIMTSGVPGQALSEDQIAENINKLVEAEFGGDFEKFKTSIQDVVDNAPEEAKPLTGEIHVILNGADDMEPASDAESLAHNMITQREILLATFADMERQQEEDRRIARESTNPNDEVNSAQEQVQFIAMFLAMFEPRLAEQFLGFVESNPSMRAAMGLDPLDGQPAVNTADIAAAPAPNTPETPTEVPFVGPPEPAETASTEPRPAPFDQVPSENVIAAQQPDPNSIVAQIADPNIELAEVPDATSHLESAADYLARNQAEFDQDQQQAGIAYIQGLAQQQTDATQLADTADGPPLVDINDWVVETQPFADELDANNPVGDEVAVNTPDADTSEQQPDADNRPVVAPLPGMNV